MKWMIIHSDLHISMHLKHMERAGHMLSCTVTLRPYLIMRLMMMNRKIVYNQTITYTVYKVFEDTSNTKKHNHILQTSKLIATKIGTQM